MFRKILSLLLAAALISVASSPSLANDKAGGVTAAERVKAEVAKLGTGKDARVEVKLRDNTKLKGWISEANESGFTVMEAKSGKALTVAYPEVTRLSHHHYSYGTRLLIGAAAMLLVGVLVVVLGGAD